LGDVPKTPHRKKYHVTKHPYRKPRNWRKPHNEELNDLYSSHNIVWVIKSRRMRLAGHVARKGERRGVYQVLVGTPRERHHLGDPGVDGRIILKWFFKNWDVEVLDCIELAQNRDRRRAPVNVTKNLRVP
jgi:hypothetical protein